MIYREGRRWSEVLEILKTEFKDGPAASFTNSSKPAKRGFVQERRISRKATLKIVDPAREEAERDEQRRREAA